MTTLAAQDLARASFTVASVALSVMAKQSSRWSYCGSVYLQNHHKDQWESQPTLLADIPFLDLPDQLFRFAWILPDVHLSPEPSSNL
jgi:hypothetical protein